MGTIVDLSLTFTSGKRGVTLEPALSIREDGFNTTNLHIYSHALTHMDAPKHFIDEGFTMEALELKKCVGPALVVDVSHKAPHSFITVDDLAPYADDIGAGSRVLLRTDWDSHADAEDYRSQFPRISEGLAAWFAERRIWLLGVETPSVASLHLTHRTELTAVHRTLLGAEIVIVESLTNLRMLPTHVSQFIALPLKLDGSDGSPVRAIAIIDDQS